MLRLVAAVISYNRNSWLVMLSTEYNSDECYEKKYPNEGEQLKADMECKKFDHMLHFRHQPLWIDPVVNCGFYN